MLFDLSFRSADRNQHKKIYNQATKYRSTSRTVYDTNNHHRNYLDHVISYCAQKVATRKTAPPSDGKSSNKNLFASENICILPNSGTVRFLRVVIKAIVTPKGTRALLKAYEKRENLTPAPAPMQLGNLQPH